MCGRFVGRSVIVRIDSMTSWLVINISSIHTLLIRRICMRMLYGFGRELGQLPTVQFLYCSTSSSLWCPRQRRQWLRWASNFANWPRMQIDATCTLRETYICTRSVSFNEKRELCAPRVVWWWLEAHRRCSCCLRKWMWTYLTLHCDMPTIKFVDFHLERGTSTEHLKIPSFSFQPSLNYFLFSHIKWRHILTASDKLWFSSANKQTLTNSG